MGVPATVQTTHLQSHARTGNYGIVLPVAHCVGHDANSTQNTIGTQNSASQLVYLVCASATVPKLSL